MATFLTWLADELRAAGLTVVEYQGWKTRARSSGGFTGNRPWCVMWHHTASPPSWDGQRDASYIAEGDSVSPIANIYIDRQGTVWVLAAGATNTNGKGQSMRFSRGTVPADQMNTHAVGMEMGNTGVGEAWPVAQTNAAFTASNAINARLGNQPTDVATHNAYAPTRKIDPATANAVQGPWRPRPSTSSGTWHLEDVRAECARRAATQPAPVPPQPPITPPVEDDEMRLICFLEANGTIWVGNGIHRHGIPSMDVFNNYVVLSTTGAMPLYSADGRLVRSLDDVATGGPNLIEAMGVPV